MNPLRPLTILPTAPSSQPWCWRSSPKEHGPSTSPCRLSTWERHQQPWPAWLPGAASVSSSAPCPLEVLLPALMRASHHNGPALYGAVLAALGAGGLAGSLIAGSWRTPTHFLPAMVGAWPSTVTTNPWAIGTGLFFYGALIGVGMVIWGTVLQEHVPLEMLGRVASLDFFISIAFMPLSIALTGILSRHLNTSSLFIAAGLAPLATAAVLAVLGQLGTPDQLRVEQEAP